MDNNWMNFDLKNLVTTLRENVRQFGGFSPEQVRQSGLLNEEGLRAAILKALAADGKTGKEIMDAIQEHSHSNFRPTAGTIYPLLESMTDEGLVSSIIKKDRKVYSLTKAGSSAAAELPETPTPDAEAETQNAWSTPKWVDLRGVIPVAAGRLAKVSAEVAKFGTKQQQEAAAAAIDEARRKLHQILAND